MYVNVTANFEQMPPLVHGKTCLMAATMIVHKVVLYYCFCYLNDSFTCNLNFFEILKKKRIKNDFFLYLTTQLSVDVSSLTNIEYLFLALTLGIILFIYFFFLVLSMITSRVLTR